MPPLIGTSIVASRFREAVMNDTKDVEQRVQERLPALRSAGS
jgi:hypothetical protein